MREESTRGNNAIDSIAAVKSCTFLQSRLVPPRIASFVRDKLRIENSIISIELDHLKPSPAVTDIEWSCHLCYANDIPRGDEDKKEGNSIRFARHSLDSTVASIINAKLAFAITLLLGNKHRIARHQLRQEGVTNSLTDFLQSGLIKGCPIQNAN